MSEPINQSPGRAAEAVRRRLQSRQDAAEAEVARIIEVGRELVGAGTDPKIADLAKQAKVSIDAFYRYFGSKQEFVAAVAEDGSRRTAAYVSRKMAEHDDPRGRLRAAVVALVSQASNPEVAAATRNILGQAELARSSTTGGTDFETLLADLLAPLLVELGSVDAERDSRAASALLSGAIQRFVWSETTPTDADTDHLVAFILRAVRPA